LNLLLQSLAKLHWYVRILCFSEKNQPLTISCLKLQRSKAKKIGIGKICVMWERNELMGGFNKKRLVEY
jgi:hypothetical protein